MTASFLPSLLVPIVGFLTPLVLSISFLLFVNKKVID